ncbi:MAG: radical SAM protein [Spirochaetes bacterium GWF1_41_5]|nr:MAG: radical SAM protein [Spirochaetes bacterium GWF1_41_5]HBE04766.1 radical SAM protein [Spirochaetia bacterium]
MRLLLTSVFGPFGVNDRFGRAENKMELFHNQVTREQGIFSFRFHHPSFGLYFLAENILTPATVLDFPDLDAFKKEIKKNYDYVGISFIIPNFAKAKEMAGLVRKLAPATRIILGGHGTNVPDLENLIEHDHICRGEGLFFLRSLLGEDTGRPIIHPLINSSYNKKIMGVTIPDESGVIIPGVGCANKCRFCATSHFFGEYTPYLKSGQDIYDLCCRYEDEMNIRDFGVLDENFLKMPERAMELAALMEKNRRFFTFGIFSSAETLAKFPSLDFLLRLGVTFIWMGVESKKEVYEKNAGVDFVQLVRELRRRGISVMTSVILFSEQHDKTSIWEDIDFAIELNSDYVQYMQLGPIPGTTLYKNYLEAGKLFTGIPFEEQHGQDKIWFHHPSFTRRESSNYLKKAFAREYAVNGASFARMIKTNLDGFNYCRSHADSAVQKCSLVYKKLLDKIKPFLSSIRMLAFNKTTRELIGTVKKEIRNITWRDKFLSAAVRLITITAMIKTKFFSDKRHPPAVRLLYRWSECS